MKIFSFKNEAKTDKIDEAKTVYEVLIKCGTKHMLLFLHYVLHKVNALNVKFQSEHVSLYHLFTIVATERSSIFVFIKVLFLMKLSDTFTMAQKCSRD